MTQVRQVQEQKSRGVLLLREEADVMDLRTAAEDLPRESVRGCAPTPHGRLRARHSLPSHTVAYLQWGI